MPILADTFPRYLEHDPLVPVFCLTPGSKPAIHRFFDTSPISPSGRYLVVTEFPFEDRVPAPGDHADVVVIDLVMGVEVYRSATAAWDTQLGAQAQWGKTDTDLFFNRMDSTTWIPFGVRVDILGQSERKLQHTVYMVSPDGDHALSPCLRRIAHVQPGYGVIVRDLSRLKHSGASSSDGIHIIDTRTGESRLLVSLAEIVAAQPETFEDIDLGTGGFYGFHVKWNPQGTRIMFVIRWVGDNGRRESYLITCDRDGGNIHTAIDAATWRGGHHPNWCPDGETIVMNLVERKPRSLLTPVKRFLEKATRKASSKLKVDFRLTSNDEVLRFALFKYDGSNFRYVGKPHRGSGHPTMCPGQTHVLTDAYPREPVSYVDGSVPIRRVGIDGAHAQELVRIDATPTINGPKSALRIDPHPAWTRDNSAIVFNGAVNGSRRVFIALMENLK